MNYLLDTCTFLWTISEPKKLSKMARSLIEDPDNEIYLSSVSAWEIAIQISLKRLSLPYECGRFIQEERNRHQILSLSLTEEASLSIEKIPDLHKDSFDRMLICQSLVHAMPIITPDTMIAKYPIKAIW